MTNMGFCLFLGVTTGREAACLISCFLLFIILAQFRGIGLGILFSDAHKQVKSWRERRVRGTPAPIGGQNKHHLFLEFTVNDEALHGSSSSSSSRLAPRR
jgi:hypothetical protein